MKTPKLTHQRLVEVLNYEPTTGEFSWKGKDRPRTRAGDRVGCVDSQGYRRIMVDGELFHGHRLAWFYVNQEWPTRQIEMVNGDKADVRLGNLALIEPKGDRDLTVERLRELLSYDPETGIMRWKKGSARAPAGSVAGATNELGYVYLGVDGRKYLGHRLAWLLATGQLPPKGVVIDHANGKKDDNRLCNLRLATNSENNCNSAPRSTNTSGHKGVSFVKNKGKWVARIIKDYRIHILGYFATADEAKASYDTAARMLHGEFARLN